MERLTKTQIYYLHTRFSILEIRVLDRFDKLNPPKKLLTWEEKIGLIYRKEAILDMDQFEGMRSCPYGKIIEYYTYPGEEDKEAYNETLADRKSKLRAKLAEKRTPFIDRFVMREYTDVKALELYEKELLKEVEKVAKKPVAKKGK